MKEEHTFFCGFCGEDFRQVVTVDLVGKMIKLKRDSIKCPRCGNFIEKDRMLM
jgi:hypothetical protein